MAFRTNKVPAIEERTVSGSRVSFNSAFALPLKACKVSFSATQAGSGDPSPSNPRAISGVSAIGLTANSTPVSVSLGEERFGGELDLLTGELTITHRHIATEENWARWPYNVPNNFIWRNLGTYQSKRNSVVICNKIKSAPTTGEVVATQIASGRQSFFDGNLGVRIDPNEYSSTSQFAQAYGACDIVYELREPITIQLSANELSSIIGNNTFSTDTGTLEITFADLQEKSASGNVASFNTALAMPLVECKTEFMATQASGTPSPSNPLPITGVDKVAIQQTGGNLWNEQVRIGSYYKSNGTFRPVTDRLCNADIISVLPNTTYFFFIKDSTFTQGNVFFYDGNGDYISYQGSLGNSAFTTPANCRYINIAFGVEYGTTYNNDISINADSTDTAYHPYISNTVTLINLDGTRYGGYVDVVRKKLVLSKQIKIYDGSEDPTYTNWRPKTNSVGWIYEYPLDENIYAERSSEYINTAISDKLSSSSYNQVYSGDDNMFSIHITTNSKKWVSVRVTDTSLTNRTAINAWLENNPITIVYPLETPIEISLSDIPTLSTIIGNNSFASDSGSIELKHKDLDIAKRGNFREVFKLPS